MSVTVNYLEEKRDSMEEAPPTFQEPDYPKNAWYAAAWDVELKQELLARRICDQNLVMYRRRDGRPVALQDACWHRMLPLSEGKLVDDDVACGYHGLIYNSQGRCVFMPSQNTINPAACVKSYPVVERHRFVWVWPGDPALADPDKVPDLHWNDDPDWIGDGDTIKALCNYKLVVDNLMDLTHETFVHGGASATGPWPRRRSTCATATTTPRWSAGCATSSRRRSGRSSSNGSVRTRAAPTAGRSWASSRRARSRSTWAWRWPARARRRATAPGA